MNDVPKPEQLAEIDHRPPLIKGWGWMDTPVEIKAGIASFPVWVVAIFFKQFFHRSLSRLSLPWDLHRQRYNILLFLRLIPYAWISGLSARFAWN